MKRVAFAILFIVSSAVQAQKTLDDGVAELATQISTSAAKQEKQKIAVLPFRELDGQPTILGTYLAEELVTRLFQLGNFKIVERQLLDKVLGELKIQQSGAIDAAAAKEIGRIAAVDAIVTGSITELGTHIAINCRLIDTTTGEVFGAAQTRIAKDEDVTKIMNSVVGDAGGQTSHQANKAIATKDLGSLRVTLKSVLGVVDAGGYGATRVRWTFTFENREARRPIVVAFNAEDEVVRSGLRINSSSQGMPLRSSVIDDRGGSWKISSTGLGGMGYVRAGVHGRNGKETYSPMEIARLLRLRDELGRETDDPSDGMTAQADSVGEGGSNISFGGGRNVSPVQFFPYRGNRFVSGTTTVIEPGQATTVTMDFRAEHGTAGSGPVVFQFSSEIVVGVGERTSPKTYSLHNLTFDRIALTSF